MIEEYFSRGSGIFNPENAVPINIIGVGAIGSFTALSLAKMGLASKMYLYDGDTVNDVNIGCQLYGKKHLGMLKVDALKEILVELTPINSEDIICCPIMVGNTTVIKRFITILGLDTMKARKIAWNKLQGKVPLLVDGRIGGQVIRVFSVRDDYVSQEYYKKYLYSDEEASDMPCAERSISDVAFFMAGIIARNARMYLSHNTIIGETCFDARTFSFYTTNDEESPMS